MNKIADALSKVQAHLSNADVLTIHYTAEKYGTTFDVLVANILKDWCDDADADVQNRVDAECGITGSQRKHLTVSLKANGLLR